MLNPQFLFTLEYEAYIQIVNPEKNIIFLESGESYESRVKSLLDAVTESCVDLKNLGNTVY